MVQFGLFYVKRKAKEERMSYSAQKEIRHAVKFQETELKCITVLRTLGIPRLALRTFANTS